MLHAPQRAPRPANRRLCPVCQGVLSRREEDPNAYRCQRCGCSEEQMLTMEIEDATMRVVTDTNGGDA